MTTKHMAKAKQATVPTPGALLPQDPKSKKINADVEKLQDMQAGVDMKTAREQQAEDNKDEVEKAKHLTGEGSVGAALKDKEIGLGIKVKRGVVPAAAPANTPPDSSAQGAVPGLRKGGPGSGVRGHTTAKEGGPKYEIHGADTHPDMAGFMAHHAAWSPADHKEAAATIRASNQGKADTHLANAHAAYAREKDAAYKFHGGNKAAIHAGAVMQHIAKMDKSEDSVVAGLEGWLAKASLSEDSGNAEEEEDPADKKQEKLEQRIAQETGEDDGDSDGEPKEKGDNPFSKGLVKAEGEHIKEGSRGGVVIGHTGGGKPIYQASSAAAVKTMHPHFTAADHESAAKRFHASVAAHPEETPERLAAGKAAAEGHEAAAKEKGSGYVPPAEKESVGRTSSGKPIHDLSSAHVGAEAKAIAHKQLGRFDDTGMKAARMRDNHINSHVGFTAQDHREAANRNRYEAKRSMDRKGSKHPETWTNGRRRERADLHNRMANSHDEAANYLESKVQKSGDNMSTDKGLSGWLAKAQDMGDGDEDDVPMEAAHDTGAMKPGAATGHEDGDEEEEHASSKTPMEQTTMAGKVPVQRPGMKKAEQKDKEDGNGHSTDTEDVTPEGMVPGETKVQDEEAEKIMDFDTHKDAVTTIKKGGPGSGIKGHTTGGVYGGPNGPAMRSHMANQMSTQAHGADSSKPYGGMNLTGKVQKVVRHQEASMHHMNAMGAHSSGNHMAPLSPDAQVHQGKVFEHAAISGADYHSLSPSEHEAAYNHHMNMSRGTDDSKEQYGHMAMASGHANKLAEHHAGKDVKQHNRWSGNAHWALGHANNIVQKGQHMSTSSDLSGWLRKSNIPGAEDISGGEAPDNDLPMGDNEAFPNKEAAGADLAAKAKDGGVDGARSGNGSETDGIPDGVDSGENQQLSKDDPASAGKMNAEGSEPGMVVEETAMAKGHNLSQMNGLPNTVNEVSSSLIARLRMLHGSGIGKPDMVHGVGLRGPAAPAPVRPTTITKSWNGAVYSDASDNEVEAMMTKADGYYGLGGQAPTIPGDIRKGSMCKACGSAMPSMLTKCAGCGAEPGMHPTMKKAGFTMPTGPAHPGLVRFGPAKQAPDLVLPNGTRKA